MQRWGISRHEFTTAISEYSTEDQILAWVSGRVTPDHRQVANAWVLRQKDALDRHDAEEGVPGAVVPKVPSQVMLGLVVAAISARNYLP